MREFVAMDVGAAIAEVEVAVAIVGTVEKLDCVSRKKTVVAAVAAARVVADVVEAVAAGIVYEPAAAAAVGIVAR